MLNLDRDLLYCDLVETYGLYDMYSIGLYNLAVLACGLRDDSRIKIKMNKVKTNDTNLILAAILDRLSLLVYAQTEDAKKNRNRPKMLADTLIEHEDENQGFNSGEDFSKRRKEILNGNRIR